MVSLERVAKEAGVSRAAVSHVLNGRPEKVGLETRRRILELAERLNYVPNGLVKAMRTKRTHALGIIIPDIRYTFFPSIVNAIETSATTRGYSTLICQSHYDPALMERQVTLLRERRVDGLIFTPVATPPALVQRLLDAGVKMVLLDGKIGALPVPMVDVDDYRIGRLATEHMLGLGHRCIAYIGGELIPMIDTAADRYRGYKDAMAAAGCEERVLYVEQEFRHEGGHAAAQLLRADRGGCTAVVAPTDMAALGMMQGLRKAGISMPDDISISGVGNLQEGEFVTPGLTSISQHAPEMGKAAATLLIDAIESGISTSDPKQVWLEPALVVRESTSPL